MKLNEMKRRKEKGADQNDDAAEQRVFSQSQSNHCFP